MFNLNLRSAAPASLASRTAGATAPSNTLALNEVPWTVIDADENDSLESTPSTPSGDGSHESGAPGTASPPQSPQFSEPPIVTDQDPYPHCPIFIPSKGRADLDRCTMATFIRDLVPFVLVVEQNEAEAYSAQLDRLVRQRFGTSGMFYSSTNTDAAPAPPQKAAETKGEDNSEATKNAIANDSSTTADLWVFPCACCCHDNGNGSGTDSNESPSSSTATAVVKTLAHRMVTSFHHGYVFEPPTESFASGLVADDAQGREKGTEAAGVPERNSRTSQGAATEQTSQRRGKDSIGSTRRSSPTFVLRDVNEIRALFRIEVLPESNRGVSYVRNYILQVLVPRVMVACGVDWSGNMEELCLSGPGEHSTLTPAALRSAALDPEVYNALQSKTDMERYLDVRRNPAPTQVNGGCENSKKVSIGPTAGTIGRAAAETTSDKTRGSEPPSLPNNKHATRGTPRLLHGLFGFYWVFDDDIYGFYAQKEGQQKQQRISSRAMLREVESRLRLLRRNADLASPPPPSVPPAGFLVSASAGSSATTISSSTGYVAPQQQLQQYIFTCKEDALANNFISGGKGTLPTLQNYSLYYSTACFSLEYNRFALSATPDSLTVNSYNNIACLFNYTLLHNPPQMRYFPPGVPNVRRPEDALVGYLGHSMLWYRFAIREDYDFTLQLIARGLYTLRFRTISFDVPQMMKVRGGMTDYYRNCHEEIRQQNDRFVLQWPSIAQHWVKGKDDHKREDIRIRWDLLSPARAKHPGAFLYLNAPLPQLQPQRTTAEGSTDVTEDGSDDHPENGSAGPHKRARPESPTGSTLESNSDSGGTARRIDASSPKSTGGNTSTLRDRRGGYVVERWRDIDPAEAKTHVGLVALPNNEIHIGQTVAAIPPFFEQQPSVVLATVIERSVTEDSGATSPCVEWTVVAQDVRGMPFLHVKTCYHPPEDGIVKAAEKLDQFFAAIID